MKIDITFSIVPIALFLLFIEMIYLGFNHKNFSNIFEIFLTWIITWFILDLLFIYFPSEIFLSEKCNKNLTLQRVRFLKINKIALIISLTLLISTIVLILHKTEIPNISVNSELAFILFGVSLLIITFGTLVFYAINPFKAEYDHG